MRQNLWWRDWRACVILTWLQDLRCLLCQAKMKTGFLGDLLLRDVLYKSEWKSLKSYIHLWLGYVQPQHVNILPITIIDVFDRCSLNQRVREETYKCYPNAKLAHLKSGGNFPFLSRSEEVNLHLVIHLRNFENALWQWYYCIYCALFIDENI